MPDVRLLLWAEVVQAEQGPMVRGAIQLQPFWRLVLAGFYVVIAVAILYFPAAALEWLRGVKDASSIPYSFVASGFFVLAGLFFARIQAAARRVSEIEMIGALLRSLATDERG